MVFSYVYNLYKAMFNVSNSRPLIPRQQTYVLDRKLVTIHSDDRDIKKWPFSNHFEVELPQIMENVESMRLVECNLPINDEMFKNDYQNTKISFTLVPKDTSKPYYSILFNNIGSKYQLTIQDGFYCPEELAAEIQDRMNAVVGEYILSQGLAEPYCNFRVYYDKVGMRFWFGNIMDSFELLFDHRETYELKNCEQPDMWLKNTRWGLPYYLGFERKLYSSTAALTSSGDVTPIHFSYFGPNGTWMTPTGPTLPVYFVQAPLKPFITGESSIYMECKKYNSMDELKPYVQATNNTYNNDYNGYVNSCFAKIPIQRTPVAILQDSRNGFLQNVKMFDVPEEKISKIEVKFRYHDGRLVDFETTPFDFSIEFNQLKNEIQRSYQVRIPNAYRL